MVYATFTHIQYCTTLWKRPRPVLCGYAAVSVVLFWKWLALNVCSTVPQNAVVCDWCVCVRARKREHGCLCLYVCAGSIGSAGALLSVTPPELQAACSACEVWAGANWASSFWMEATAWMKWVHRPSAPHVIHACLLLCVGISGVTDCINASLWLCTGAASVKLYRFSYIQIFGRRSRGDATLGNDAGRDTDPFSHMSPSEFKWGWEEVKREELNQQSRRLLSVSASTISDSQRVGEGGGASTAKGMCVPAFFGTLSAWNICGLLIFSNL